MEVPDIFLPSGHAFIACLLVVETDEEPAAEDLVDVVALGRVSLQAHLNKILEVGGPVALNLGHVLVDDRTDQQILPHTSEWRLAHG